MSRTTAAGTLDLTAATPSATGARGATAASGGALVLKGVSAFYDRTQALHGVDLTVEPGTVTALLGANGAGKTTTLRAVSGMVRTQGEISFAGENLAGRATEDVARRGIAHVPDGRGTFVHLTTEENLALGAYTRKDKVAKAADLERMYAMFPRLKQRYKQQAGTLSGGEQQMLAIARALMLRPRLLLLDEPSFGLAPLIVAEIYEILAAINKQENVAMLLVEQNAVLALEISTRAYLLETGRVVMSGDAKELAADESIRRAYLGY